MVRPALCDIRGWGLAGLSLLLLNACTPADEPAALEPLEMLTRASLDLRGVRPSVDELAQIEADPAELDALIDSFVEDERFGSRVRDLFAVHFRTRADMYYLTAAQFGLQNQAEFLESVGEEPLQMLAHLALTDRPYTDLVTGDWTMANETLAAIWPIEYQGPGWQPARYTDGRPAAGVLSANSMWWRYPSNATNYNRARANAVSRIFLCHDYLSRPVGFDRSVNLIDQGALEDAIRTDPGCVNCHASLDPLASYFYGFTVRTQNDPWDYSTYHPDREADWRTFTGVAPGYFGEPGYTLTDLGQQVAGDDRFIQCAVERVWEGLLQRDAALLDTDPLTLHREAFLEGELTLSSLFRSVVDDPRYRAQPTEAEGYEGRKMVTPALLASALESLTGYRFEAGGYDMLTTDTFGLRTLAGGADGEAVTAPARVPNSTMALSVERVAQAAARFAVAAEGEQPADQRRLFRHIGFDETPDDTDVLATQLQSLHWALYGDRVALDGPEVQAGVELWSDLYRIQASAPETWAGVLSVLFRDPEFLFY